MNKHLIVIGVVIILLAVGLSGCNEVANDDEEFIRVANVIVDDLSPVSSSNLISRNSKASEYELMITEYTLSSEAEKIREELNILFSHISTAYGYLDSYLGSGWVDDYIKLANGEIDLIRMYLDDW